MERMSDKGKETEKKSSVNEEKSIRDKENEFQMDFDE